MVVRISREAREELLAVARDRYRRASKQGKSRVLNELVVWQRHDQLRNAESVMGTTLPRS